MGTPGYPGEAHLCFRVLCVGCSGVPLRKEVNMSKATTPWYGVTTQKNRKCHKCQCDIFDGDPSWYCNDYDSRGISNCYGCLTCGPDITEPHTVKFEQKNDASATALCGDMGVGKCDFCTTDELKKVNKSKAAKMVVPHGEYDPDEPKAVVQRVLNHNGHEEIAVVMQNGNCFLLVHRQGKAFPCQRPPTYMRGEEATRWAQKHIEAEEGTRV